MLFIVVTFCAIATVLATKSMKLYNNFDDYDININNNYYGNCDQISVGSCWITQYGVMTKDSCCFLNNSTSKLTNHEGYWDQCYVTKNPNGKLYLVSGKVANGCNVYMSCHMYTVPELIAMAPKSPIPSIPSSSYPKPKKSVRDLIVLTIFFMLFMTGAVLIVISQ